MDEIIFEGKKVVKKNGVYKCPFRCGDSRYPQPRWKTEKGFRKHMEVCPMRPSAIDKRNAEREIRHEREVEEKSIALENCPYHIGDTVHCVIEIVVKPTHDSRGRRVRYEPVKSFVARTKRIDSIDFNGSYIFNNSFYQRDIFPSLQDAERKAEELQKSWDEHVAFSEFCR